MIVVSAIEIGYRFGNRILTTAKQEKESPVSAIVGSILGLLAFILAFTFSMVTERFDARKALVREEASALRNVWLRADFLPDSNRDEVARLLRSYIDHRINVLQLYQSDHLAEVLDSSERIQKRLWDMAVTNARVDMNSDVAALYIEALNEMINVRAMRITLGLHTRLPMGIWLILYMLVFLSMAGVGYQTAIVGSRRSWSTLILAISFSLVIALISILDRPYSRFLAVPQDPLQEVLMIMDGNFKK
ncbi:MAG: DUF4239 domain-containing protein [Saprospiraceae bacterium]|nr:DUF4239 domain-containing protein [Saprospiraceae bacterium]